MKTKTDGNSRAARGGHAGRMVVALIVSLGAFSTPASAQVYSIGQPSNEQQYMLELINRARASGAAEAARLGLSGLQEGLPNIVGQIWTIPNAAQPLSWSPRLFDAAQAHAERLNDADQFFLGVSPHFFGGTGPQDRIAATGYLSANYNGPTTVSGFFPGPENVSVAITQGSGPFGGAKLLAGVLEAHNDLFTDQTVPGRAHRITTMLSFFREAGFGVSAGRDNQAAPGRPGGLWDSLYLVQNFGTQSGQSPFLTGVVYQDANGNGFYDPGEGIGGVNVHVTGTSFSAVSSSSGGYSVPVPGDGSYTATFSGAALPAVQRTATVANGLNAKLDYLATTSVPAVPTVLGNISTRLRVESGNNVLIGGFIVTGTQPKRVILRAIGSSLPLAGRLENPTLELNGPNGFIASNDNWQDSPNRLEIIASTVPPGNVLESAIVATLPASSTGIGYTAIVRGANGGTGIGLVEVFDLDRTVDSKLANISSRGVVGLESNVMIGGFIVLGTAPQRIIARAIGPSLPLNEKLADPTLELVDSNGAVIASNDNWRTTQQAEIIATTVPPSNDLESALVVTLPASATGTGYTAIVRGNGGTTGVALVEVFALN